MKNDLEDIVTETFWSQKPVAKLGGLTRIDHQYASFQNANNTVSILRSHRASPVSTLVSETYVSPRAEQRWKRAKVVGNVGGNVFGPQLDPLEESISTNKAKVLTLANFTTTPTPVKYEAWLDEALEELASCSDDAIEEDLERPSNLGLVKAKELITDLAMHLEFQPDVYPMDLGSIAIDIRHPNGKLGVLYVIERDAQEYFSLAAKERRAAFELMMHPLRRKADYPR